MHVIIRFRAQGNRGTLAQTAFFPSILAGLREQFVLHVTFRPWRHLQARMIWRHTGTGSLCACETIMRPLYKDHFFLQQVGRAET